MKTEPASIRHRDQAIARADAEIVAALASSGVEVDSISRLVNTKFEYSKAYGTLVDFLDRSDFPIVMREMIARALTEKKAHDKAFDRILDLFRRSIFVSTTERDAIGYGSYQFALANALSVLALPADRPTLKGLAADRRYGNARSTIIDRMRRWPGSDVDAIITAAIGEQDAVNVRYSAIQAAGARRMTNIAPLLRTAASDDPNENIRWIAKKALKRIEQV